MLCDKCGNEIKEDLFCNKCGEKIKDAVENKTENNSNEKESVKNKKEKILSQKLLLILLVIAIVAVIICIIFFVNKNLFIKSDGKEINNISTAEVSKVYEINQMGILRNKENFTYENFNNKSDLTEYRNIGDNAINTYIDYEYDDMGRIVKLTFNNKGAYVKISYLNETNNIEKIEHNISETSYIYTDYFYYTEESEYPVIYKYFTQNGKTKKSGYIFFKEIELNSKKYIFSLETDENYNIVSKKINIKVDKKCKNIFESLEIIPLEYFEGLSYNPQDVIKTIMLDTIIKPEPSLIISHGQEIYEEDGNGGINKEKVYDDKDRVLYGEFPNQDYKLYYKYNDINNDIYEYSVLMYFTSEDGKIGAGLSPEKNKDFSSINSVEENYRIYLNDEGSVIKIECLGETIFLNYEDTNKRIEEYSNYLKDNMIDTSSLNFDNSINLDLNKQEQMTLNSENDEIAFIEESKNTDINKSNDKTTQNENSTIIGNNSNNATSNYDDENDSDDYISERNEEIEKQIKQNLLNNSGVYIERDNKNAVRAIYFTDNDDIKRSLTDMRFEYTVSFSPSLNGSLGEDSITLSIYHHETGKTYKEYETIMPVKGTNTFTVTLSAVGMNNYKKITNSFVYSPGGN